MTVNRRTILIAGLALSFTSAKPYHALAHRLARTETDVRIDDEGRVSITHVYHMQDAQNALYKTGRIDKPDLTSLKARATLALYTEETFSVLSDGEAASLTLVGAEIQGDSIYVYQEGQIGGGVLSIDARMLRDIIRGQSNSVNIIRDGQTTTLDFAGDDGVKAVA